MRTFLLILLLAVVGAGAYGYVQNPAACVKLGQDVTADLATIYTPAPGTTSPVAALISTVKKEEAAVVNSSPTPSETPQPWSPPAVIPAQPNWTWTTAKGTFKNVQIVKVEADCVTILHSEGGALVPISDLPADLQKQLNYNPTAATTAAAQRQQDDAASAQTMAQERSATAGSGGGEASDYASAVAQAKSSGKRVLVHFTGSDWCPYCKSLDQEVLSSPEFGQFVAANYIFVTLDFPHNTELSPEVKQANEAVKSKFAVSGFPTLLVIDANEKELGRETGYNPGSGPQAVISDLKSFNH